MAESNSQRQGVVGAAAQRRGLVRAGLMRVGLWLAGGIVVVLGLTLGLALAMGAMGRALPVPQFAVAQLEARLNGAVARSLPGARLAINDISLSLVQGFAPRLQLRGVRLLNLAGKSVMDLPQVQVVLAPVPLLSGQVILRQARLGGAGVQVTRDMAGQLDIAFAAGAGSGVDMAALFALRDRFFATPLGAQLRLIEAEDLHLSLHDQRLGRTWALGQGHLRATQEGGALAMDLGLVLMGDGAQAAVGAARQTGAVPAGDMASLGRVDLTLTTALGTDSAAIGARVSGVLARDLAAQAPPLAFISVLDAPLSGQIAASVTPQGLSDLTARLDIGAGALAPTAQTAPVPFQSAQLDLRYSPRDGRILLNDLRIISDTFDLRGGGHADLIGADGLAMRGPFAGALPAAFVVQLRLDSLRLARPEIFTAPVTFGAGAADLRLRLDPFSVDIGQIALIDGDMRIHAKGRIAAQDQGWKNTLDMDVSQISAAKLLGLWPKSLLPATRTWLDKNLLAARFSDLRLALRQSPGEKPLLDLGYHFDGLKLTPLRSLPAITDGAGYGSIRGRVFSMMLEQGRTTPPLGGDLDLAGSAFAIPDIGVFPATGNLTLRSAGSLTATLSLLDQRPFQFLSKSGREVDFATGRARLTSQLALPLKKVITLPDVTYQVQGEVSDFATDRLVAGHAIAAPLLDVSVSPIGLRIAGQGDISGVPFDAAYVQDFGPNQGGRARVEGGITLSDAMLRTFGLRLPEGMVTGAARAELAIALQRGRAGQLVLTSDLNRLGLALAPLGYAKAPATQGQLRAEITLASPPQITRLAVKAGDLVADGAVRLTAGGGLQRADFAGLTLGKWLAGDVALIGQGAGQPMKVQLTAGTVDLRHLPDLPPPSGNATGKETAMGASPQPDAALAMPISLRLDQLRVSDGIILSDFQGDFLALGGLSGNFAARLAGGAPIQGQLSPAAHGTAVQITAQNAGAAMAQAGLYTAARGGALDLRLTPMATQGSYLGDITIAGLRVQYNSVLADLLNSISVVGLLDQLSGAGISFGTVTGQFVLSPQGIDLREGVATGPSLGVTLQGAYQFATRSVDMQGVISPVYILNRVGEVISGRGEGVLGFNYRLRGPADAPRVTVNPLSVLLPGFFRNIFKSPTPRLPPASGQESTP